MRKERLREKRERERERAVHSQRREGEREKKERERNDEHALFITPLLSVSRSRSLIVSSPGEQRGGKERQTSGGGGERRRRKKTEGVKGGERLSCCHSFSVSLSVFFSLSLSHTHTTHTHTHTHTHTLSLPNESDYRSGLFHMKGNARKRERRQSRFSLCCSLSPRSLALLSLLR